MTKIYLLKYYHAGYGINFIYKAYLSRERAEEECRYRNKLEDRTEGEPTNMPWRAIKYAMDQITDGYGECYAWRVEEIELDEL